MGTGFVVGLMEEGTWAEFERQIKFELKREDEHSRWRVYYEQRGG